MSRLIDADYFKEQIVAASQMHKIDPKKMHLWTGLIDVMPTAYDVDKVVEELEHKKEEVQRMRNTCVALSDLEVCDIENVTYKRAIEIVKQGGVADDVCEWHCDEYGRYHTECHILADNDPLEYTYCPYCGKKIKVVE